MADCTKTSIVASASTYERSSGTNTALVAAAANVIRRASDGTANGAGKIGLLFIGMSNQANVQTRFNQLYTADPERRDYVTIVKGGRAGYTARQWSDPAHAIWPWLDDKVTTSGLTNAQVQICHMMMTNAYPATYGAMTAAQIQAIVGELDSRFPNLALLYMSGINYTGYSDDAGLSSDDRNRAPEPYVHDDADLLASLVGTLTIPSDFFDIWANGTTANTRTNKVGATTADCDAISYACADFQTDGVHQSTTGLEKQTVSLVERFRICPAVGPILFADGGSTPPPVVKRGLIRAS